MSRYIDADALMKTLKISDDCKHCEQCEYDYFCSMSGDFVSACEAINEAPSIDIVFCEECRHSFINENHPQKPRICGLTKMCGTTKDDWFCADGEREGE